MAAQLEIGLDTQSRLLNVNCPLPISSGAMVTGTLGGGDNASKTIKPSKKHIALCEGAKRFNYLGTMRRDGFR